MKNSKNKINGDFSVFDNHISKLFREHVQINDSVRKVFELQIRLIFSGQAFLASRNFTKSAQHGRLTSAYKIVFYFTLVLALLRLPFKKVIGQKKKLVFLRCNSFSAFSQTHFLNNLRSNIKAKGFLCPPKTFLEKMKYLASGGLSFECLLRSFNVHKFNKKIHFDRFSDPELFLTLLENHKLQEDLEKDLKRCQMWIRVSGFSSILLHTDQTFEANIVCQACKELNVKFGVVAHGYFTNKFMVSVLPIHGMRLFVWTQENQNLIKSFCKSSKIQALNGLKRNALLIGTDLREKHKKLCIIGSPLYDQDNNMLPKISSAINRIKTALPKEFNIVYCPHPAESPEVIRHLRSECKISTSENGSISEILTSNLIVGGNTSLLFECSESGLNCFQIKELCLNEEINKLEGVTVIDITELSSPDKLQLKEKNHSALNFEPIYEFIK